MTSSHAAAGLVGSSGTIAVMRRVVILGRGGAGKSTLAATVGTATGLPVVELDRHFWGPGLEPHSARAVGSGAG